ncbi:hypothetical protein KAI32_02430 [Candidatus Pacearchaeota archaeon]|nr:hypothetical protein [Candidatus Pacearchaeota archaeon]
MIEKSKNPYLEEITFNEKRIIKNIQDISTRIFIDLGAGTGRFSGFLSKIAKKVYAIEINSKYLAKLNELGKNTPNLEVFQGNILDLNQILEGKEIKNPVILLPQNTLSIIENAREMEILSIIKKFLKDTEGELIITFALSNSLKDWGMKFYESLKSMVGEPDYDKIDFNKGIFISKTGYVSRWHSMKEISIIKEFLGGKIIEDYSTRYYRILHISFS